ncbi:hypothetical protein JCM10207_007581 [Rhodosporidiobolus poonsookiae]
MPALSTPVVGTPLVGAKANQACSVGYAFTLEVQHLAKHKSVGVKVLGRFGKGFTDGETILTVSNTRVGKYLRLVLHAPAAKKVSPLRVAEKENIVGNWVLIGRTPSGRQEVLLRKVVKLSGTGARPAEKVGMAIPLHTLIGAAPTTGNERYEHFNLRLDLVSRVAVSSHLRMRQAEAVKAAAPVKVKQEDDTAAATAQLNKLRISGTLKRQRPESEVDEDEYRRIKQQRRELRAAAPTPEPPRRRVFIHQQQQQAAPVQARHAAPQAARPAAPLKSILKRPAARVNPAPAPHAELPTHHRLFREGNAQTREHVARHSALLDARKLVRNFAGGIVAAMNRSALERGKPLYVVDYNGQIVYA